MCGMKRMRNLTVNEMVSSERDYVLDLELLIELYADPLTNKNIIPEQTHSSIFSTISNILNLNKSLLSKLEKYILSPEGPKISPFFTELVCSFSLLLLLSFFFLPFFPLLFSSLPPSSSFFSLFPLFLPLLPSFLPLPLHFSSFTFLPCILSYAPLPFHALLLLLLPPLLLLLPLLLPLPPLLLLLLPLPPLLLLLLPSPCFPFSSISFSLPFLYTIVVCTALINQIFYSPRLSLFPSPSPLLPSPLLPLPSVSNLLMELAIG